MKITNELIEKCCKWICLVFAILIISNVLYSWRDARYDKVQSNAKNLAISLSQLVQIPGMPVDYKKQVNGVLEVNGFPQYKVMVSVPPAIPDTTKGK